ncbi:MAG: hypothetical protein JW880_05715 [Candidatus Thermoplasmatota archaeon]|nr:hypothetical protein [Candidatus Thermoplasmatota archaeon]
MVDIRRIMALGSAAASALLAVLACALPWYSVEAEFKGGILGSLTWSADDLFYVDEWQLRMTGTDTITRDYDDDESPWGKVGDVMVIESVLALVGILSLMFGSAAIMMRSGMMATLLCGAGTLVLASAAIYFFAMIPAALTGSSFLSGDPMEFEGFWGSDGVMLTHWYVDVEWGPGVGWYLVVVSAVLALSAFMLVHPRGVDRSEPQ